MTRIKPKARFSDIVVQDFDDEILIYDLKANKAFNLNQSSKLIWQMADGEKTITEIAETLSKKLDSKINEEFVWLALKQLKNEKLIEIENGDPGLLKEVSRRDLIRKVGLTTFVSLPLITSLLVPTASLAATLNCSVAPFSNGCACTAAGQCQSNCCGSLGGSFACTAPGLDPAGQIVNVHQV